MNFTGKTAISTGAEGDAGGMDYPTAKAGLMYGLTKSISQWRC